MKTLYVANDDTVFTSEDECRRYEVALAQTVNVPVLVLNEAIRQATPYMVSAKERRMLADKLKRYLPTEPLNAEVSEGGPLTHELPAAQSRPSLH